MSLMVFARDNTRDTHKTTRFKRGGEGAVKFDGDLLSTGYKSKNDPQLHRPT